MIILTLDERRPTTDYDQRPTTIAHNEHVVLMLAKIHVSGIPDNPRSMSSLQKANQFR